jgi:hypothetical protein
MHYPKAKFVQIEAVFHRLLNIVKIQIVVLTMPHLNGIAVRNCGFLCPGLEKLIHNEVVKVGPCRPV